MKRWQIIFQERLFEPIVTSLSIGSRSEMSPELAKTNLNTEYFSSKLLISGVRLIRGTIGQFTQKYRIRQSLFTTIDLSCFALHLFMAYPLKFCERTMCPINELVPGNLVGY